MGAVLFFVLANTIFIVVMFRISRFYKKVNFVERSRGIEVKPKSIYVESYEAIKDYAKKIDEDYKKLGGK